MQNSQANLKKNPQKFPSEQATYESTPLPALREGWGSMFWAL